MNENKEAQKSQIDQQEQYSERNSITDVSVIDRGNTDITQGLTFNEKLLFFETVAKSANTGIKDAGQAMVVWQKAKELKIGWANAIPHMHIINGKAGIDIHIIKAILSRPGSGVRWDCIEDNEPIYRYLDKNSNVYIGKSSLPQNAVIKNKLSDPVSEGMIAVVVIPEQVKNEKGVVEYQVTPYDHRSSYIFTRKKKDIDGRYFTVESRKGVFSWRDALAAGLPINREGILDPNSSWQKYRKLMIDTRAFTFGARDIASDLLMGCYETTELYDMEKVNYTVTEDGKAEVIS